VVCDECREIDMCRSWLLLLAACIGVVTAGPGHGQPIEAGVAITDSDTMQELERSGLSLSSLLREGWQRGARTPILDNSTLAELPAFRTLASIVRYEFKLYQDGFPKRFPRANGNFGPGTRPDYRLFERGWLFSAAGRFDLVGVVNRMDRAYRSPETCGEIRLIYRLAYAVDAADIRLKKDDDGNQVFRAGRSGRPEPVLERDGTVRTDSRLPMTVNLVLRARNAPTSERPATVTCGELARRWLAAGASRRAGGELAALLLADGGALATLEPSQVDRMETNIQITRVPSSVESTFGGNAEYLLHIFKWDLATRSFARMPLENQIDRQKLQRNPELRAAFKVWLFTPANLHRLVEGTLTIPDEYLALRAITSAPGGTARASNRPFLGVLSREEIEQLWTTQRAAAAELDPERRLRSIASPLGLEQRLTDMTCSGCHQSRAIGGFHFLGADWASTRRTLPQNAIFIAGSPHFYADLPRRRAVLAALAADQPIADVDFGRGFSMRPRRTGRGGAVVFPARFDALRNGWGSNCAVEPARGVAKDPSFADWGCAEGLQCKALHESDHEAGLGVCVTAVRLDNARRTGVRDPARPDGSGLQIGDPFLFGRLTATEIREGGDAADRATFYRDGYCATADILNGRRAEAGSCLPVPGSEGNGDVPAAYQKGGFFSGMFKRKGCAGGFANAVCGNEAGATFTQCAVELTSDGKTSFVPCLTKPFASDAATLRACDAGTPCRDDYVCLATTTTERTRKGACLPPYFLFQFRIDGHPNPPEGPAPLLR
jgi:hypothetical protein